MFLLSFFFFAQEQKNAAHMTGKNIAGNQYCTGISKTLGNAVDSAIVNYRVVVRAFYAIETQLPFFLDAGMSITDQVMKLRRLGHYKSEKLGKSHNLSFSGMFHKVLLPTVVWLWKLF